jgi:hypothetical protein
VRAYPRETQEMVFDTATRAVRGTYQDPLDGSRGARSPLSARASATAGQLIDCRGIVRTRDRRAPTRLRDERVSYVRRQGLGRNRAPERRDSRRQERPELRRAGSERRRSIGLLSAGWLPLSVSSSRGFPRSRGRASNAGPGHITSDGSSPPFRAPLPDLRSGKIASLRGGDLPSDGP